MRCLDDDLVLGLVEGRLGAAIVADIDGHLDDCSTCRDVVAQVARVQAPARVLERGRTVGRYVIGELLGAGAMGRVYSAWEPELDRRVALKLLVTDGEGARERVVREAQAMARLDHPNVVGVHEVGTSEDGVYVAMNLVEGETLRAWAASPRPWREVVGILVEVARGLAAVHAAGVIHRDIKPDNIIVGADGARLGDFGLARSGGSAASSPPAETSLAIGTPATAIAGTPAYMAPEVLRGGGADASSDQFSFGVTAYEVLAGRRPFKGTTWAALVSAIEAGAIDPIRAVPRWLSEAITRCLSLAPEQRFVSMRALADHLAQRSTHRSPTRWIAGAALAAALASGGTWFALRSSSGASCAIGADELAAIWNPSTREQLADLGAPALASLDRWATSWSTERDATCRAASTDSAPRVAARERCLDQRRAELGALLDRLAATPELAARAVDALQTLPPPSDCSSAVVGMADPVPLDPAHAAQVREVVAALPDVRAAIALGDARPVVATIARLVDTAERSGHAPTLAEALLVEAEAQRGASNLDDAASSARDALAAAERGHADLIAARAWIARVATAGDRRELALADDFAAIGAAAIDRAGAPPHLVATLLRLRGLIAYNRGDLAMARTHLVDARERFVITSGARSLDVSTTESALGSVARAANALDDAERWHRSALAIDLELRGPTHPDIARDLHNIAGVLRLRGDLDAAAKTYREALVIEEATRGPRSIEAALTHNSLGLVNMERADWAAARSELVIARDLLTAANHGDRAFAHHNLGLVDAATGDHRGALDQFAVAAQLYSATIGDTAAAAIRLREDRAVSELALTRDPAPTGRPKPARAVTAAPAPHTPVKVVVEPSAAPPVVTAPAMAAEPPTPPPPAPPQPPAKRDVGVYGSTQSW